VVVHDALGFGQDIRNQADWLAEAGYLAVVPNLFAARGRTICMVQTFRGARERRGGAYADLVVARDWLAQEARCTGRIGIIGYCFGGGLALLMAPGQGFDVASVNYGSAPRWAYGAGFLDQACPIVGSFGAKDPALRGAAERLTDSLEKVGVEHDVKEYAEAGHTFINDLAGSGDLTPTMSVLTRLVPGMTYDEEAAEDAKQRILQFFGIHLAG
jgi:carboxymethylenebutenolidase